MAKAKRYDNEPKLNFKKVFAVIIGIAVVVMFGVGLNKILKMDPNEDLKEKTINYYAVFTDGKWGVIDTNGNITIKPEYDEIIVIPDSSKQVFLCTYDVNYVDNTYKTKAINANNEEIFTEYNQILSVHNYDENNNFWYEKNVLKVEKEGLFGLIDIEGKEIVTCNYKEEELEGMIIKSEYEKQEIPDTIGKWRKSEDFNAKYYTDI